MIVVADTTPINYLVLINHIEVLPGLFARVIVPPAVARELDHRASPPRVRHWISSRPGWLSIAAPKQVDLTLELEDGEREAIALAEELHADALLVDEKKARRIASDRGLTITGTLGIIKLAAAQGMLDAHRALSALRDTSFFIDESVIEKAFGAKPPTEDPKKPNNRTSDQPH